MQIYGREIKFRRTVGATCDIADLCPDKDISNLGDVMTGGSTRAQFRAMCGFVAALNKGYVDWERFNAANGGRAGLVAMNGDVDIGIHDPLTFDELSTLAPEELTALFVEAMKVFNADAETTVETEPQKKMDEAST